MNRIISELEKVSDDVKKSFGNLSSEQINFKPSSKSWSIGQCFDHLIKTNTLFFPEFESIINGTKKSSLWENYSPFTSFLGNLLIKRVKNDNVKVKAPSKKLIPPSSISADIVKHFAEHQIEVIGYIRSLESVDLQKTVATSPVMSLMTYKIADGLTVIVEHEKRHFRQATRVMQTAGFPE
jgi:DinB superfamily